MLELDFKDFMCDNYLSIKPMKKVYFGRFMLYNKWINCSLKEVSDILTKSKKPYDCCEAQEFMMGLRKTLEISDGYDTYLLTR